MVYDKSKPSVNLAENEHKKARERYAAEKAEKASREAVEHAQEEQKIPDASSNKK